MELRLCEAESAAQLSLPNSDRLLNIRTSANEDARSALGLITAQAMAEELSLY